MDRKLLALVGLCCLLVNVSEGMIKRRAIFQGGQCVCQATGDPHYRTFDGVRFDFMGTCKYILAETNEQDEPCSFSIRAYNKKWLRTKTSVTESLEIRFMNHVFTMGQKFQLTVDGRNLQSKSVEEGERVRVFKSGNKMSLLSNQCGLLIEWNGRMNVHVRLDKARYAGNVRGLCGNCNGNRRDDITITMQGTPAKNAVQFANSYILPGGHGGPHCEVTRVRIGKVIKIRRPGRKQPNGKRKIIEINEEERIDEKAEEHPCVGEWERRVRQHKYCGLYLLDEEADNPFAECIRKGRINIDTLYQSCRFDVCSNKLDVAMMHEIVCQSISSFDEECAAKGFEGIQWRNLIACGQQCSENQVYSPKVNPCPATCDSRRSGKDPVCANLPSSEGCQCKPGFLMLGSNCVAPDQCPADKEITLTFTKITRRIGEPEIIDGGDETTVTTIKKPTVTDGDTTEKTTVTTETIGVVKPKVVLPDDSSETTTQTKTIRTGRVIVVQPVEPEEGTTETKIVTKTKVGGRRIIVPVEPEEGTTETKTITTRKIVVPVEPEVQTKTIKKTSFNRGHNRGTSSKKGGDEEHINVQIKGNGADIDKMTELVKALQ